MNKKFKKHKEENIMPKLQTFYGVWTTDDEMHGSFKAYAQTRELAEEDAS